MRTRARIRPARSNPKHRCVRGHDLRKSGFYWNRVRHGRVIYLVRRCKRCAVEDVQNCRKRRAG